MPLFLLVGCPGQGDRMVSRTSVITEIKNNHVCIVSTMNPGEKVTAVKIYSNKGDAFIKTFDDNPLYVAKNRCLPLFNYAFHTGRRYSITYNIATPQADDYLITSEFHLIMDQHTGNTLKAVR